MCYYFILSQLFRCHLKKIYKPEIRDRVGETSKDVASANCYPSAVAAKFKM